MSRPHESMHPVFTFVAIMVSFVAGVLTCLAFLAGLLLNSAEAQEVAAEPMVCAPCPVCVCPEPVCPPPPASPAPAIQRAMDAIQAAEQAEKKKD
jgi:hypothetical protein